ncbi:MAG: Hint domain-containing protein [Rhodobacteraceae bacterium]|nr:Hint domain-containing protein [Paracoccaceae bacterium]
MAGHPSLIFSSELDRSKANLGNHAPGCPALPPAAAFAEGTLIETGSGLAPVETLEPGGCVVTRGQGLMRVVWVGMSIIEAPDSEDRPVMIRPGALGAGMPGRGLVVAPDHRVLLSRDRAARLFGATDMLVAARDLKGMPGVVTCASRRLALVHVLLERHDLIRAEGVWAETFEPTESALAALSPCLRDCLLSTAPRLRFASTRAAFANVRPVLDARELAQVF